LQPILVKPSDLIIEILIQEKILESLFVENDIYKPILFESIINDSTNGPIIENDIRIRNHQSNVLVAIIVGGLFTISI
jgi:hypothetical protein